MKQYKFKNGLVLLYERNTYSNLDSFQINVNTGSLLEKKAQYGINHLVEHLIFKSTKTRTTQEISTELEITGANINAWTSYTNVRFYFDALPKYVEKCAEIYADMMFNKSIKQAEFDMEKDVVCQEIAMYKDRPDIINEENWWNQFYEWEPVVGTAKSVKKITLNDVNKYIENYYNPQNMIISVCSKLSFHSIKKIVAKYYGSVKNSEKSILSSNAWGFADYQGCRKFVPDDIFQKQTYTKKKSTSQVQIAYGYNMGKFNIEKIEFLNSILCDGLSSVLYREVREKHGLCYGITADVDPFFNSKVINDYNHVSMITASTEKQNVDKFRKVFERTMAQAQKGTNILDTDIERAKNAYESKEIKAEDVASYNHYRLVSWRGIGKSLKRTKKEILMMNNKKIREMIHDMLKNSDYNVSILGKVDKK